VVTRERIPCVERLIKPHGYFEAECRIIEGAWVSG
jgi:hypothetical protein